MRKIMLGEGLRDRGAVSILPQFEGIPPRPWAPNEEAATRMLCPSDELVVSMAIRQRGIAEGLDPAPALLLKRRPGWGIIMGRAYLLDDWDGRVLWRRGIAPVAQRSGNLLGRQVRGDDRGI